MHDTWNPEIYPHFNIIYYTNVTCILIETHAPNQGVRYVPVLQCPCILYDFVYVATHLEILCSYKKGNHIYNINNLRGEKSPRVANSGSIIAKMTTAQ